jgi:hypothetical protein
MEKEILLKLISMLLSQETADPAKGITDLGMGEKRIVILQRGWVYVGDYYKTGTECKLENASCIRAWGTSKGLGELAENGPLSGTKLDPCPTVNFHHFGEVHTILCNKKSWK